MKKNIKKDKPEGNPQDIHFYCEQAIVQNIDSSISLLKRMQMPGAFEKACEEYKKTNHE